MMTFNEFQAASERTKPCALPPREQLMLFALGLSGEAAEVGQHIKKWVRSDAPLDTTEIDHELGDCLWYLSMIALACGLNFDDIAAHNVEKLRARFPSGFTPDGGRR